MQNYSKQIIHELCEDLINNIYIKGMRHNIYTMNQQSDKVINEIKSKCYKFI